MMEGLKEGREGIHRVVLGKEVPMIVGGAEGNRVWVVVMAREAMILG